MIDSTNASIHKLRVDQVGSLLRPESLKNAFVEHERGELTDDTLRSKQEEAIAALIRKQESIGLPVVTDGEFRRDFVQRRVR